MSGKIILLITKIILLIMKTILRIVGLETGYAERIRKCQEKVHVYERLCLEGTTERSDGNTKFADESERSELSEQTR